MVVDSEVIYVPETADTSGHLRIVGHGHRHDFSIFLKKDALIELADDILEDLWPVDKDTSSRPLAVGDVVQPIIGDLADHYRVVVAVVDGYAVCEDTDDDYITGWSVEEATQLRDDNAGYISPPNLDG